MKSICPANNDNCGCTVGKMIEAHNNAVGTTMIHYVPALRPLLETPAELNLRYVPILEDSDPDVASARGLIAEGLGVAADEVIICGSLLEKFGTLAKRLGCETLVRLNGDFGGFEAGAEMGVRMERIEVDPAAEWIDPSAVAAAVRDLPRPLVCVTFPCTNPYQQKMSVEVVQAVLASNPEAIVLVDDAYRRFGNINGLAKMASVSERIIYVQTASKDMFVCGARIGWIVCAPRLRDAIRRGVRPYVVSPVSVAQLRALLGAPEVMDQVRAVQQEARDILASGITALGLPTRTGQGPWLLIRIGEHADLVEKVLRRSFGIRVQMQTSEFLRGWLRISATVPCEARTIVAAVSEVAIDIVRWQAVKERLAGGKLMPELLAAQHQTLLDEHAKWEQDEWENAFPKDAYTDVPPRSAAILEFLRRKCA
jgi:histidinol-phosphate/aromatic aminotransferase/cobyric acid decarboxylase-like protein